jgi:hypothetical protein
MKTESAEPIIFTVRKGDINCDDEKDDAGNDQITSPKDAGGITSPKRKLRRRRRRQANAG